VAALEKAGAHVTFGVKDLKIHGKTALVIRKEASGLRAYAHIGTGNYHVRTACLYADAGLQTCDPVIMRDVVTQDEPTGRSGVDRGALCEASRAGVSIDLIVRGFCCLKLGVPGQTENIRVRSIIGRFLEHSRIYYFGAGAEIQARPNR
jgi:polyphosphate kinase